MITRGRKNHTTGQQRILQLPQSPDHNPNMADEALASTTAFAICQDTLMVSSPSKHAILNRQKHLESSAQFVLDIKFWPTVVVQKSLINASASSKWAWYALRWKLFLEWCEPLWLDPERCLIPKVLTFLHGLLDSGMSPSTPKIHHDCWVLALPLVLKSFKALHKPLQHAKLKWVFLNAAFLLAIASLEKAGKLHALVDKFTFHALVPR